ncbi:MAG TPA: hypothetical protein VFP49_12845 [Nitrososphaeraceae archaeon]|nr:hypothetical protein [Nitrososphaeraceae archaeon]
MDKEKTKYSAQKLTNDDKKILDQIVIKYALKFYALTEKYPCPKKYVEEVILKRIHYDANIALLYSISYIRTNPSIYQYKPGQLNENIANDIRNTIIESYPRLVLEDPSNFKGFLPPRDLRERVTKKLVDCNILNELEGKEAIRKEEQKTRLPGRKSSSDEVRDNLGGKPFAYQATDEVEKLKKTIKKSGAIEYVYDRIMSSNLPHKFAKFSLLVFFHASKLDEIATQKMLGIGAAMMKDMGRRIDRSELLSFKRFLDSFDDEKLEQYADEGAQFLINERTYHTLLFFLAGLLKV